MSDELQNAILKLIEKNIDHGTSFLETQIPDVISQILTYNFAVSLFGSVLSAIWLGLTIAFTMKAIKLIESIVDDVGEQMTLWLFVWVNAIGCVAFIAAGLLNLDWVQIWLAPKLYLIEYARGF